MTSKTAKKTSKPDATTDPGLARQAPNRRDRFGWVLTASIVFHLVIVLGVSFVMPSQAGNTRFSPPLKIILVDTPVDEANPDADTLAQANSIGEEDPTALPPLPGAKRNLSPSEAKIQEQMLVEERTEARLNPDGNNDAKPASDSDNDQSREQLTRSIDIAFLNSQAEPRERFVASADARSSVVAPYLEKWRLLVERVGNINYPDEARKSKIEGDLVMDVTVLANGSVAGIKILRSSGEKVLDDGAERIVQIAAPYEPFSAAMRKEFDTLHIIRTWRFSNNTIRDITR